MNGNGGSPYGTGRGTPSWQRYGGQQNGVGAGGYGMYQPSQSPSYGSGGGGGGLAPLSMFSQGQGSPGGNSPRTPVPNYRGRLSPASQMMSPGSDPFNPVSHL